MRTSVALLEVRPETIIQDYGRLLKLIGLRDFCSDVAPVLVPGVRGFRWFPGQGTPPWQLDGVLAGCKSDNSVAIDGNLKYLVVTPDTKSSSNIEENWGWAGILREKGLSALPADSRKPLPYRPQGHFPSLEASLPRGLALPPALWDKPVIMLPVASLGRHQPLLGCVDFLEHLLGLELHKGKRQIPRSEVLAELLGYVKECLPQSIFIMDAVILDVPSGNGGQKPVLRHVILAGKDALAVDATAMRLLGFEPTSLPWVRLAVDRGSGVAKKNEISVLGQPELLDLDFQNRKSNLSSLPDWENPFWMRGEKRVAKWFWNRTGRAAEIKKFRDTSWGSLFEAYQARNHTGVLV